MDYIIRTTLYLLASFIPLTFTLSNSELFEFPKFILLLSGTLVITVAWAIHMFQTRDFKITRASHVSPLHIGILTILITQTISTIFSINPYTSFWGYYSRFHQGLLTTICYTIIYFASIKWLDTKSTLNIIKISVGTAFLISLYAVAEHYGIDKNLWVQDVQSRVFSTLGQPNWLAAYLIPNLFLTLYLSQISKNKNSPIFGFLFLCLFVALLYTKSRSGIIGFGAAFVTYYFLLLRQFSFANLRPYFIRYTIYSIVLVALIGTPFFGRLSFSGGDTPTPPPAGGTALETGGTESGDIRKIVWTGAIDLIKKYPLLGTGPETFAYTYYWVRPLAHNLTSEWDFLYNKAHNEYLNIAAGSGIIGLLAYLYFHFAILSASLTQIPHSKKVKHDLDDSLRHLYPVLGASIVGFTITNFFGFSVIPVYLMMILIAALPSTLVGADYHPPVSPSPIYLLIFLVLIYPIRLFLADIYYARGKAQNSIPLLKKAISIRPGLDLYHSQLGELYATTGQSSLALTELATNKKLNPYHLNFYKSRAKIYLALTQNEPAAAELEKARELAPSDPKLAYNLGLVYTRLDQVDLAEKHLKDALLLKPNYAEPYYALTLLYEQTGQSKKIPALLDSAQSNLATYSSTLKDKIEKYTN